MLDIARGLAREFSWTRMLGGDEPDLSATVARIVEAVRREGDAALQRFSKEFDRVSNVGADNLRVPDEVVEAAHLAVPSSVRAALCEAAERIRAFHSAVLPQPTEVVGSHGERLGMVWHALGRVGVYAPGGRAAYPSTVLMNAIPAQVAAVPEIVLVSPPASPSPWPHPLVLVAAQLAGVTEIYAVGGAQAIAALAYGTETIRRVDKIVGPGNRYVASAKRLVMGDVGLDSIAGPSEVFVLADKTAQARVIAADVLAQAEHDEDAGCVVLATDRPLLDEVALQLEVQLSRLPRREIAAASLSAAGALLYAETMEEALGVVERAAPEHVELLVDDARRYLPRLRTAGAVFVGMHTPEAVGDYFAGPNHVLPTHGTARYASGLSVHDFLRRNTYVEYTAEALAAHADAVVTLARAEGLDGHAASVCCRVAPDWGDGKHE
ncbi:MAG: histidinol dehydrogenase [Alicyclobacillaceae bacterium]|uniref:histidinol dehydrogenase n=1 Tax=Alicyclobacillus sp. SP_1 TaxID=2942475 RepID=UPI00215807FE|nr:histidinol dehydrogenase [Alicyclobacillus sp. SP_1]MCY0887971.1 histidinol dehydrogenase [Alicyclobacillaceae bacterium]